MKEKRKRKRKRETRKKKKMGEKKDHLEAQVTDMSAHSSKALQVGAALWKSEVRMSVHPL